MPRHEESLRIGFSVGGEGRVHGTLHLVSHDAELQPEFLRTAFFRRTWSSRMAGVAKCSIVIETPSFFHLYQLTYSIAYTFAHAVLHVRPSFCSSSSGGIGESHRQHFPTFSMNGRFSNKG